MKRSLTIRLASLTVAASLVSLASLPANADTGAITLAGIGNYDSPPAVGVLVGGGGFPLTFTFSAVGAIAATTERGALSCVLAGGGLGTLGNESGSFSGSCESPFATNLSGTYIRTGAVVTVSGTATATSVGGFSGTFTGACTYEPLGGTQFAMECAFTLS